MAKTFDNISEASATNYLFLFAQRTLALQNEPPTPPPLNVLGLPCEAMCRLWARRYPEKVAAHKYLSIYLKSIGATGTVAAEEKAAVEKPAGEAEQVGLRRHREAAEAVEAVAAPEAAVAAPEVSAEAASAAAVAEQAAVQAGQAAAEAETPLVPEPAEAEDKGATFAEKIEPLAKKITNTFAEKIEPLAEKIKEYILDHQDDAAQEDRWRTTMKRETMKCFREQREESGKQREAIDKLDSRFNMQREAIDEAHSKMDEKMEQLVNNIADLVKNIAEACRGDLSETT
jgi:hypothetical protein